MERSQGKVIGNYKIGECIGSGGYSKVYKGLHNSKGTFVAIKEVTLNNMSTDQIATIQKEINLLNKLSHPNIVRYIDSIYTESYLYIVLEYVENGSLAEIAKKFSPIPESVVAIYIKQVLLGLEYLHDQAVIHRDIKGANLLLTKDGLVKVADFGVATKLSENEKINSAVGTPYWMAPEEVINNSFLVTAACDIWSLGCTILELLTGSPPYYNLNQVAAMLKISASGSPPIPEGISTPLKDFLKHCFSIDPTKRKQAGELLIHPWIAQLSPETIKKIAKISLPAEIIVSVNRQIEPSRSGRTDARGNNQTIELSETEEDNSMV